MSTLTVGITGVTGNLGRRLLQHLLNEKHIKIFCLVRDPSKLKVDESSEHITIIHGDLHSQNALEQFVKPLDVCIHLASLVGYGSNSDYRKTNIVGTENLCRTIKDNNLNCRLIHCSSITVLRRSKKFTWLNTRYANSKYHADLTVQHYEKHENIKATYIYPGLIYGPEDLNLIPTLRKFLSNGLMFYITGGEKNAPVIYIDDLCQLFIYATKTALPNGQKLIGVGPQEMGIHDFIDLVADNLQQHRPRMIFPKWALTPLALFSEGLYQLLGIQKFPIISKRSVDFLSINLSPKLVDEFNRSHWKATTTIEDGLKKSMQWYNENKIL